MKFFRGLVSLLPLGLFRRRRCLYCRVKLGLSRGSTADVAYFDCPRCGREFEQETRGRLREHWRTPLKEALFMASQSTGSLASLGKIQGPWRDAVVEEVQRELEHPSRCLTDLFRYASPRSEAELREYLRVRVEPVETEA